MIRLHRSIKIGYKCRYTLVQVLAHRRSRGSIAARAFSPRKRADFRLLLIDVSPARDSIFRGPLEPFLDRQLENISSATRSSIIFVFLLTTAIRRKTGGKHRPSAKTEVGTLRIYISNILEIRRIDVEIAGGL